MANSLKALRASRTSLKAALEHGASVELWPQYTRLEGLIVALARRLRTARLERLKGRAAA
jgi:hypothetical protein